jgi:hypothetical protein
MLALYVGVYSTSTIQATYRPQFLGQKSVENRVLKEEAISLKKPTSKVTLIIHVYNFIVFSI